MSSRDRVGDCGPRRSAVGGRRSAVVGKGGRWRPTVAHGLNFGIGNRAHGVAVTTWENRHRPSDRPGCTRQAWRRWQTNHRCASSDPGAGLLAPMLVCENPQGRISVRPCRASAAAPRPSGRRQTAAIAWEGGWCRSTLIRELTFGRVAVVLEEWAWGI